MPSVGSPLATAGKPPVKSGNDGRTIDGNGAAPFEPAAPGAEDDVPPLHAAMASAMGMRSAPARPAIRVTIIAVGFPQAAGQDRRPDPIMRPPGTPRKRRVPTPFGGTVATSSRSAGSERAAIEPDPLPAEPLRDGVPREEDQHLERDRQPGRRHAGPRSPVRARSASRPRRRPVVRSRSRTARTRCRGTPRTAHGRTPARRRALPSAGRSARSRRCSPGVSVATRPSISRASSAIEWRTHSRLIRRSSAGSKGRASRRRIDGRWVIAVPQARPAIRSSSSSVRSTSAAVL